MTHKQTAEAYVREKLPELMELSFGCQIVWEFEHAIGRKSRSIRHKRGVVLYRPANPSDSIRVQLSDNKSSSLVRKNDIYVVGHPIQLQHWLRVLSDLHNFRSITFHIEDDIWEVNLRKNVDGIEFKHIRFNLTTGQPATEADYQAFCEIVGV